MAQQADTFSHHLKFLGLTLSKHVTSAKMRLKKTLEGRKTIYLDTNFLVHLRNHELGRCERLPANFGEFHQLLKSGVETEKLICPISEHLVAEVLRQSDEITRAHTLRVLGHFSRDIGFVNSDEVRFLELSMLLCRDQYSSPEIYDRANVWTKAPYCLGAACPEPDRDFADESTRLAIQKGFFDRMWQVGLVEFFGTTPPNVNDEKPFLQGLALSITDENSAHADELRSFRQAFEAECRGMADSLSGLFDLVVESVSSQITRNLRILRLNNSGLYDRTKINIICASLLEDGGHNRIPSAYVAASLHASRRWNKGQRVKVGDFFDYEHAAAALPYSDAFFTEWPLATAIKQHHLSLDKKYNCFVTPSVDEAVGYLKSLG